MAADYRRRAIEGNTVRKLQPEQRPTRERRQARPARRHTKEEVQYVHVLYVFFMVAATCLLLWSCIGYLQLQAETTGKLKTIASLETQLEDLKKENDDNYTRIMTSVDLDYIRDVAVNELGMVYAGEDQVILYDAGTEDYVRQNSEIDSEEKTLLEQVLGK